MSTVFTGSIAYDYLMTYPGHFVDSFQGEKLEALSVSFLADSLVRQRGGVAANVAYTHALLGGKGAIVAAAGGLDFAPYKQWLDSQDIDTNSIQIVPDTFTASFFATTDRKNLQIASFYPGAMSQAQYNKLSDLTPRPKRVMISANDPNTMVAYTAECQALSIEYIFDPGQQVTVCEPADLRSGIRGAKVLFVNQYEWHMLEERLGITIDDVRSMVEVFILTLGEDGSKIYTKSKEYVIPAVPPTISKDPTGSGDAYRGGFMRVYNLGLPLELCGQIGALAATYCLEEVGTQNHTFKIKEFINRFRRHFDDRAVLDRLYNRGEELP